MTPTDSKIVISVSPSTTTATQHTAAIDTKGFSFARIICISESTGTLSAGTANKIEEGDAATGAWSTFTGFIQGTDWTASTATNSTALAKMLYNVPLGGRKRYLKVTFSHATGNSGGIIAELSRPSDSVGTSAEGGAANSVGF